MELDYYAALRGCNSGRLVCRPETTGRLNKLRWWAGAISRGLVALRDTLIVIAVITTLRLTGTQYLVAALVIAVFVAVVIVALNTAADMLAASIFNRSCRQLVADDKLLMMHAWQFGALGNEATHVGLVTGNDAELALLLGRHFAYLKSWNEAARLKDMGSWVEFFTNELRQKNLATSTSR